MSFVDKRSYPKCFHYDRNAIFIYDLINEKYVSHKHKAEIQYLYSLYTLLLCGMSSLNLNLSTKNKILLRFSRFINFEGISSWEFLQNIFLQFLNKDLTFFQSILSSQDYNLFINYHNTLIQHTLSNLSDYLN
jgi:hypothetical protein